MILPLILAAQLATSPISIKVRTPDGVLVEATALLKGGDFSQPGAPPSGASLYGGSDVHHRLDSRGYARGYAYSGRSHDYSRPGSFQNRSFGHGDYGGYGGRNSNAGGRRR